MTEVAVETCFLDWNVLSFFLKLLQIVWLCFLFFLFNEKCFDDHNHHHLNIHLHLNLHLNIHFDLHLHFHLNIHPHLHIHFHLHLSLFQAFR